MAADALAPNVARTSATMILTKSLCRIGRVLSYLRKDLNYLHCINVEK